MMNNPQKKNRLIILTLFGMSIVPFLIAYILKENPQWLQGRTNHGQLIIPPVPVERSDLTGFDPFSQEHIGELAGHWLIINVIPEATCHEACRDAIHKSRQLQLMMNKDLTRTRRVVLIFKDSEEAASGIWWQDDKVLLRVRPNENVVKKIAGIRPDGVPDGMLLLMDPLGNLMMQYEPGFDPYKVKSDLAHLLKISQIG